MEPDNRYHALPFPYNNLLRILEEEQIEHVQLADYMGRKKSTLFNICQHNPAGARLMKEIARAVSEISGNGYTKKEIFPYH